MSIKKGFSLAEVMATIGVLAVIAAVAMPSLRNIKPNQEMLMLKKVYYLVGRTVNELINDDEFYPDDVTDNTSGFSHVSLAPLPEALYHGRYYSGATKFCGLFAARMNLKDTNAANICSELVTKDNTFVKGTAPGRGHFTTTDGVVWVLPIGNFNSGNDNSIQSISVDVNGEKSPNCFPTDTNCKNPDRFEIKVDRWGRLYIDDTTTRAYLSTTDATKTQDELVH